MCTPAFVSIEIQHLPLHANLLVSNNETFSKFQTSIKVLYSNLSLIEKKLYHSSKTFAFIKEINTRIYTQLLINPITHYARKKSDNWGGILMNPCFTLLISFKILCYYRIWTWLYEYTPLNYRPCYSHEYTAFLWTCLKEINKLEMLGGVIFQIKH